MAAMAIATFRKTRKAKIRKIGGTYTELPEKVS
jgi:hypothetical protein